MLALAAEIANPEIAGAEPRSALTTFEGLGAGRDTDIAAALLGQLGVKAARTGPKNSATEAAGGFCSIAPVELMLRGACVPAPSNRLLPSLMITNPVAKDPVSKDHDVVLSDCKICPPAKLALQAVS
jgi:hypothetical protein